MTLAEALLPKLSEWGPPPGRQQWAQPLAATGWALNLTADRVDSLGCLLWEVALTRSGAEPVGNAALKQRAEAIAKRATGLLEPLRFIELDELRGEALLRSDSPSQRTASLAYYELVMTGNRMLLRRYQRSADKSRREQVAFALTLEAIAKLADDLARD
jgi:hypothetical protein